MSNANRKSVQYWVADFNPEYSTIDDIIESLEKIRQKHGGSCSVSKEYYDYGDDKHLVIYGTRLENDEEYNKRIENEERQYRLQEQRDAAEFARLNAKYSKAK